MLSSIIRLLVAALTVASQSTQNLTASNQIKLRQPLPPVAPIIFHNWVFLNFNDPDVLNAVKVGITDAMILADTALNSLYCSVQTVSYLRYFKPEYADRVRAVYSAVLRQRLETGDYIDIWWGDHPDDHTDQPCLHTDRPAYVVLPGAEGHVTHLNGDRIHIFLCPAILQNRVALTETPCASMLPRASEEIMQSFARYILHELLHSRPMGHAAQAPNDFITDVSIVLPAREVKAFGPYFAEYVNHAPTFLSDASLSNADNYVYFALENYYMALCNIPVFLDPQIEPRDLRWIYDDVVLN